MTFEELTAIVESNARSIAAVSDALQQTRQLTDANAQAIASNAQAIADLRQSQDELIRETIEWFGDFTQRADQNHQAILEMQSEVRGLQTENRRILERLERGFGAQ